MKIGIVTYHRTLNYGACLQAIATRVVLEQLGHEAFYIDYWPKYHEQMYKCFNPNVFKEAGYLAKVKYLAKLICFGWQRMQKRKIWLDFIDRYIAPYCKPQDFHFDAIIYGSDQIWRKQKYLKDYNPIYFGENSFHTKIHIAFSASMGELPQNEIDRKRVIELVSNLNYISVRENNLQQFLIKSGVKNVVTTLDPTFMLSKETWDKMIPTVPCEGSKYVLFFPLRGGFKEQAIIEFAKNKGLLFRKILPYSPGTNIGGENYVATPSEFVNLIKNAEYVFTSSFHGLVFSLIYNRQVFASFKNNSERARSLMEGLGILDHFIEPGHEIPIHLDEIDFKKVNGILAEQKSLTLQYLENSLS